jgi:hypothetical protein
LRHTFVVALVRAFGGPTCAGEAATHCRSPATDDNRCAHPYDAYMAAGKPYIIVKLQTKNPIELGNFVAEFTSIASQFDKFIKQHYPDLASEAEILVKQVKRGSIVIELLPFLPLIFGTETLSPIEHVNAVNEFVKNYGSKLSAYFKKDGKFDAASRSDLKDFLGSVTAIATDPDGKASIEAAVFEDGKKKIRAALKFNSKQALRAAQQIEAHQAELEHVEHADHERVLMVFRQANVKNAPVGKKSGERVMIEDISDRELPLVYASDLAEQRIKHEIREADDNLFKKGFIVDINVQTMGGRPVAYRVTNLHQVIDLPPEP